MIERLLEFSTACLNCRHSNYPMYAFGCGRRGQASCGRCMDL